MGTDWTSHKLITALRRGEARAADGARPPRRGGSTTRTVALLTGLTAVVAMGVGAVIGFAGDPGGGSSTALLSASRPHLHAITEPLRGLHTHPRLPIGGRPGASGSGAANQTSSNWSGYGATGGTYTSVTASWIEPSVDCTSKGIVAFWVGLDGWGSNTVEQDGTGVDCTSGTAQQFAWWETYPANSIQEYNDTVSAGDHLTSTVTSKAGNIYDMVLTDTTKNWTEHNSQKVTDGRNASAEVIAEAVTTNNSISQLPDFHAIDFTGSTIDGGSLQKAGAQAMDMTNSAGTRIATTEPSDTSGDFEVDYTGAAPTPTASPTPTGSASPTATSTPTTDQTPTGTPAPPTATPTAPPTVPTSAPTPPAATPSAPPTSSAPTAPPTPPATKTPTSASGPSR